VRAQKEELEEPEEEVVTRQTFVFSATLALPAELRRRLNLKVNTNKKKVDKTMMETLMACVALPVAAVCLFFVRRRLKELHQYSMASMR